RRMRDVERTACLQHAPAARNAHRPPGMRDGDKALAAAFEQIADGARAERRADDGEIADQQGIAPALNRHAFFRVRWTQILLRHRRGRRIGGSWSSRSCTTFNASARAESSAVCSRARSSAAWLPNLSQRTTPGNSNPWPTSVTTITPKV